MEERDRRLSTKKEDCEILREDNYFPWAMRIRAALKQKRWWEAIDPGYPQPQEDQEDEQLLTQVQLQRNGDALNFIIQRVADNYMIDLDEVTRAKEAWDMLRDMHTDLGAIHLVNLFDELMSIKKSPQMTMTQFLVEKQWKIKQLRAAGMTGLEESVACVLILNGLPRPKYDGLIRSIRREEALTLKNVKSILTFEEKQEKLDKSREKGGTRDEEGEGATSLSAQAQRTHKPKKPDNSRGRGGSQAQWSHQEGAGSSRRYDNHGGPSRRQNHGGNGGAQSSRRQQDGGKFSNDARNYVCFACNETGHIARDCPRFKKKEEEKEKKSTSAKYTRKRNDSSSSESDYEGVAANMVKYVCSSTAKNKSSQNFSWTREPPITW